MELQNKKTLQDFDEFMNYLKSYIVTFKFMRYSTAHCVDYLLNNHDAEGIYNQIPRVNFPVTTLTKDDLSSAIDDVKWTDNYDDKCRRFAIIASDLERKAVINTVFELILSYVRVTKNDPSLFTILRDNLWYKVLNVLRNNASHFDSLGVNLDQSKKKFPRYITEKILTWKTIHIEEGMLGHELRYNSDEVADLLEEVYAYFAANYMKFM